MKLKQTLLIVYLPIERILKTLAILFHAIGYSLKSFKLTAKGQHPKYELLQLSHRIEKGLLVKQPKPLWGWEKANRMAYLISINNDNFSNSTAKGVLKAYIDAKKQSDNPIEQQNAINFEKEHWDFFNEASSGGIMSIKKGDITIRQKEVIEHFFQTRHSCRDFQDKLVSKKDIQNAISLALRCPSACNRQVTNCYVYQSKELQTIILTTSIRAYDIGEFNDWFISPSIFAGYLSLSLHLYGIGSCIYRKQLYGHHPYNEEMKQKCNIPEDEMIIIELRIGYYKDEFDVAISNRHQPDDIITFIKE